METKTRRKTPLQELDQYGPGFDVVCIIGRVEFGNGSVPPAVAAFQLIGEHNTPGTYTFPHEDGGEVAVTVTHSTQA